MKRVLRWIGLGAVVVMLLAVIAYGVVYALSERALRRTYEAHNVTLAMPADPEAIAEGRRLAMVHNCFNSCHGRQAEGRVMFNQPMIARIVAPNLPHAMRTYSDSQLEAIIRQGVRPEGGSVLVMPSQQFAALTDADLGRILAYLKTLPATPGLGRSVTVGPLGRIGFVAGKFKTAVQLIAEAVPPPDASGDVAAFGRYLARTTCAECHGSDLRGASNPEFAAPSLRVVGAYAPDAFKELLRTGVPLGGRTLPVMGPVARENLSALTDSEIDALYTYLRAIAETNSG